MQKILAMAKEGREIRAAKDQVASPTGAVELADKMIELMEHAADGLYHVTGQGSCSRYEFAKEVVRLSGYDGKVVPVDAGEDQLTLMRPTYSVLDNFMLRISDMEQLPAWNEMLERYMADRKQA